MANQPTTTALLSLLPSYNPTSLPPRLISTASSLLAQSRLRASNLKPEEEIARAYACAEIAVNRLREPLRLPPKKTGGRGRASTGGPPCNPTVYKKLLTFLEGVLEREVVTPQSVHKRKRDAIPTGTDEDDAEDEEAVAAETPTKRARISSTTTPASNKSKTTTTKTPTSSRAGRTTSFALRIAASSTSTSTTHPAATHPEAPPSILPTIRKLCTHYTTPTMAPHVYTGVCIVLRLAGLWPPPPNSSEPDEAEFTVLTTALYLMVLTKMQVGKLQTRTFNTICDDAVEMFGRSKGLTDRRRVEEWIRRVNREGWCRGREWWEEGVPAGVIEGISGGGGVERGVKARVGDGRGRGQRGDDDDDDEESESAVGSEDVLVVELGDPDLDAADEHNATDMPAARTRKAHIQDLEKPDPEGVLLPGLGTMMQEGLDWNSAEKRRAFEAWKRGVLKRLGGGGSAAGGRGGVSTGSAKKGGSASAKRRSVAAH